MLRSLELTKEELAAVAYLNFLTIKPTMYIANVADDGFENNPHLDVVRAIAATENAIVVPVCAAIESELVEMEAYDRAEFIGDFGLDESGLDCVMLCRFRFTVFANLLYCRCKRSSRMDSTRWCFCPTSCWVNSH